MEEVMESGVEEVMEWCGVVLRIVCKAEFKTMNEWINEWINYQGRHRAARAAKKLGRAGNKAKLQ